MSILEKITSREKSFYYFQFSIGKNVLMSVMSENVNCESTCINSTVCLKKNIPDIFSYNSRKHCRIFIIFGTHVTEKVSNQYML